MKTEVQTQEEIKTHLLPEFRKSGLLYEKYKKIFARCATEGERIETITADGLETINTVKRGDYIIKNQTEAGEQYIVPEQKFKKRYELLQENVDDFSLYKAKGKIIAIEMTDDFLQKMNLPDQFYFVAAWNEEMVVKKGDFLATLLDYSEIYRIARKEFFETYKAAL